ncbi:adenylate/guanylate cyclase domain-containing protein [Desertibaculum subflavum]|uniref:adenylate/guanylate cyclase domain-containing protein n=1 Tax=Desertibaculum subflavum TaxID=2268458 RepID=UPI000E66EF8D
MTATILFVDDEPDLEALVAQKFRRQIRDGTVKLLFARDGVEALAVLQATPEIDMVVSDINMPRMDGLSLLQKLQESEEKLSTIMLSAYGDMANIRTAMNRGAFDFLTKPIDFADLEATVEKTIRHVETLREARRRLAAAERNYATLSRYFSPNLVDRLASGEGGLDLSGHRRVIASLFTDITGFTTLVETLPPDVLGPLLNDYLTGMADIVFAHEGTLTKILGDGLHVLFGAPSDQPDHAVRAVNCALALDRHAEGFRQKVADDGIALGVTRIGIDAGPALVGNFGGARFFEYTAYGDIINTAARLENANKQLGTTICISAAVSASADGVRCRPVGDLMLRGRSEPLKAYEPLGADRAADPATADYLEAFSLLEAGDPGAVAAFAALVGKRSGDRLATFHLKRLLNGAKDSRIVLE